jgi:hypothetical protein
MHVHLTEVDADMSLLDYLAKISATYSIGELILAQTAEAPRFAPLTSHETLL